MGDFRTRHLLYSRRTWKVLLPLFFPLILGKERAGFGCQRCEIYELVGGEKKLLAGRVFGKSTERQIVL